MRQDKPFTWKSSLGGPISRVVQALGVFEAGQTVLARMTDSQIWHQLAGSVGGGFRKGSMASAGCGDRHFSFSQYATGAFQAVTPVLELRGSESE